MQVFLFKFTILNMRYLTTILMKITNYLLEVVYIEIAASIY